MNTAVIFDIIQKDKPYYEISNGGVTFSEGFGIFRLFCPSERRFTRRYYQTYRAR